MMRGVIVPILLSCAAALMLAGCQQPTVPTSPCIEAARGLTVIAQVNADLLADNVYGGSLNKVTPRRNFIKTPEYQSLVKDIIAENWRIAAAQIRFLNTHCTPGSSPHNNGG